MFGNMFCIMVPLICKLSGMVNKINKFVIFFFLIENQQGTYINIYYIIRHRLVRKICEHLQQN